VKPLSIHPIQTRIFRQRENLCDFIVQSIPNQLVHEGILLAVTSKILSLAEGRLKSQSNISKREIVQEEADLYLGEIGHGCFLTIKNGLLIPSAGIDESNSEHGDLILYPEDPFESAQELWKDLRKAWNIEHLGLVVTDSHTTPLRRGVTGICLSYAGFRAVRNLVGTHDLFGRELRMTQMNYADGLAAAAVMMMGEGAEARPLAVIENAEIQFSEEVIKEELQIPLEEDLYYPLLQAFLSKTDGGI
jgi:F420-0:gamma-glutamyl ligase